jgi:hypothetical protein
MARTDKVEFRTKQKQIATPKLKILRVVTSAGARILSGGVHAARHIFSRLSQAAKTMRKRDMRPSGIRHAYSTAPTAVEAAREIHAGLAQADLELVVLFCSRRFDLNVLGPEIARLFGDTTVVGCTTAGEITPVGYLEGSITGFSLSGDECKAVAQLIPAISSLQIPEGVSAADALIRRLAERGSTPEPSDTFALLLIDGMCATEELVLSSIHRRLDPIPLLGGSAGDEMRFEQTFVYWQGRFHSDAALLTLVKSRRPFHVFRHQHFFATDTRMVVTGADPARRVVTEINAEPAGPEYARIIGLDYHALTPMMFAGHPVMVKVGGDYYVRSIQKANEDGSLTFYCAIDEGVVLTLARHEDIVENLRSFFSDTRARMGKPLLVIGFDCVLRSVEAESRQVKHVASRILAENNVIGFSTYGEQLAAMHVNYTFTGLMIGSGSNP